MTVFTGTYIEQTGNNVKPFFLLTLTGEGTHNPNHTPANPHAKPAFEGPAVVKDGAKGAAAKWPRKAWSLTTPGPRKSFHHAVWGETGSWSGFSGLMVAPLHDPACGMLQGCI